MKGIFSPQKHLKATLLGIGAGICIGYGAAFTILSHGDKPTDNTNLNSDFDSHSAGNKTTFRPDSGLSQLKAVLSKSTDREALRWLRGQMQDYTSTQFSAALNDIVAQGIGRHKALFEELCETWGYRDPKAALIFAEGMPPHLRFQACTQILKGWVQADPSAATQWVQSAPKGVFPPVVKLLYLKALAATHPKEAYAFAQKENLESEVYTLFGAIAETNPREATFLLSQIKDKYQRQNAATSIASSWVLTDPDAALAWARELPEMEMRHSTMETLLALMSVSAPLEAANAAWQEYQSEGKQATANILDRLIGGWARSNPAEARQWLNQLPEGDFRKSGEKVLTRQWALTDPLDYLNHSLDEGIPTQESATLMQTAIRKLMHEDPSTTREWLQKNKENLSPELLQDLIATNSINNPQETVSLLHLLPEGQQTRSLYTNMAQTWASTNPKECRDYLSTLPAGPERDSFLKGIVQGLAKKDVPAAIAEIETTPPGALRDELSRSLGQSSSNPAAAVDWLVSQAQSKSRDSTISSTLSNWARTDAVAAGEWLSKAPAGEFKDQSIQAFSTQIVGKDPALAVQWAGSIQNEKTREQTLNSIASQWHKMDEAAALKWIQNSPLSEKVKSQYLK